LSIYSLQAVVLSENDLLTKFNKNIFAVDFYFVRSRRLDVVEAIKRVFVHAKQNYELVIALGQ